MFNLSRNKTNRMIQQKINKLKAGSNCFTGEIFQSISFDYESPDNTDYTRYCPNYFRYVDPDAPTYPNYIATFNSNNQYGNCLTAQLITGTIRLWPTEVLFIRLVPSINDSDQLSNYKDDIRNRFISFCLNIEKSYIYYNQGKTTCNNSIVPWEALFNYDLWGAPPDCADTFREYKAYDFPLTQLDQYVMYSISVNFSNLTSENNLKLSRNPFNIKLILDLINGVINPADPQLTQINFYQLISITYYLLSFLFSVSNKLLNGLCAGFPKQFVDTFFPRKRQLYYYNTYLTWIQSRNKLFGFGDKINAGNGSSTNIQIPNALIVNNIL